MKKILLATTALIMASATPSFAKLEVTVGGFASFQAAMFDNDSANNSTRDFQSESQIAVHADGVAENGLQYGAKVLLNTSTSDGTPNSEKVALYLAGGWGRVEMGDDYGAEELIVYAPTVGIGQINGSYDDFVIAADRGHALNDRRKHNFTALGSGKSTKVTYYTPRVAGFQAGVSYAPEYDQGESVVFTKNTTLFSDMYELGLNYEGQYQDVMFKAGANYNGGSAPGVSGVDEDLSAWTVGGQVGYKGFKFGGGYADNGDSGSSAGTTDDKVTSYNVGVTYENGPWGVGVSYLSMDFDVNGDVNGLIGSDGAGGQYNVAALGGTYAVAPGLSVGADLAFYERNRDTGTDTDGYVLMTDVTAAF